MLLLTKSCPSCGRKFKTGNHREKYCSDECRKVAKKKVNKAWRDKNPDYMNKYRAYRHDE